MIPYRSGCSPSSNMTLLISCCQALPNGIIPPKQPNEALPFNPAAANPLNNMLLEQEEHQNDR